MLSTPAAAAQLGRAFSRSCGRRGPGPRPRAGGRRRTASRGTERAGGQAVARLLLEGVAGREQDAQVGRQGAQAAEALGPAHDRHRHVEHHELDLAGALPEALHRLGAVRRGDDLVADPLQRSLGHRAHQRLVVDHQDQRATEPRLLPGERLGYRTPPDLLPRLTGISEPGTDCSFDDWIALRHRAILSTALAYDRVLVYAPDEAFLRRALPLLSVEAHVGRAWLLRPRPGATPPGAELLCSDGNAVSE